MLWPPSAATTNTLRARKPRVHPLGRSVLSSFRVTLLPFLVALGAAALAGCASLPEGGVLPFASAGGISGNSNIVQDPTLSVVTTRNPVAGAKASPYFGSERASRMSIARVRLVSPAQAGRFSLAATGLVDWQIENVEAVPVLSVGQATAANPGPRDVLLYVHGYNQTFETATLDAARLADGLDFRGDTVLFSWPSRSKLLEYIRDRESALWSRDALEATLNSLLASPNIGRIHIVAHSMGSMVTTEALRQIYARYGDLVANKIGAIVYASPDLDIDGFSASVRRMGRLAAKMTVVSAADDRALAIATRVAGGNRVGSAEKARLEALGLKVVDASGMGSGIFNHDLFLTNSQVRQVIRQAIDEAKGPAYAGVVEPSAPGQ